MPTFYGTHNKLERGEFRADIILQPIEPGKIYPDSKNVELYKGWLGVLADHLMLSGVLRFVEKRNKNANVMVSFNEQDWGEMRGSGVDSDVDVD
jgi:hypothetical protein